jgi:hypothetical protein
VSYSYEEQRAELFTDDGQRLFIAVRDHTLGLIRIAGAVQADKAMNGPHPSGCDSWGLMACIDRMVELREIKCVYQEGAWQHRVYMSTNHD